jgi:hypothetical protein
MRKAVSERAQPYEKFSGFKLPLRETILRNAAKMAERFSSTAARKLFCLCWNQPISPEPMFKGVPLNRENDHDQAAPVGSYLWHRSGVRGDTGFNQIVAGGRNVTLLAVARLGRGESRTASHARERCRC